MKLDAIEKQHQIIFQFTPSESSSSLLGSILPHLKHNPFRIIEYQLYIEWNDSTSREGCFLLNNRYPGPSRPSTQPLSLVDEIIATWKAFQERKLLLDHQFIPQGVLISFLDPSLKQIQSSRPGKHVVLPALL